MTDLEGKLQIKPGQPVIILNAPDGFELDALAAEPDSSDAAVLAFVRTRAELEGADAAFEAGRQDRLTWIAYPKAGQLGTDLNRDRLVEAVQARGLRGVRQVAIDSIWSALRFRPA